VISYRFRIAGFLATAAIVVGACSAAATPSPTVAPTVAPAPTPIIIMVTPTPAPTATPAPTQLVVATVPADQLVVSGKLTVCSDLPYPPQEYFDPNGDPIGADIDIGAQIALRLGLKEAVENTVFESIIPALQGSKCDIIISAMDIRPDRLAKLAMIPYFKSGQGFVVAKGNPDGINATTDLCGKSVGVEGGTSEFDHLNGTGSFKPADGLNNQCTAAGKAKIDIQPFAKDSDALLALQSGKVSTYFTDLPVAAYYVKKQPDQFELAPLNLNPVTQGIAVSNDPTKAPLVAGVKTALQSMMDDGSYLQILKNYNLQAGALTSTNP
jgi:polar amino acid transport system substrate-binding protein